jgi:NodT family efflux transporter outer membrane factor (OMF) lipoprotein
MNAVKQASAPAGRAVLKGCAAGLLVLAAACAPKTKYVVPSAEIAPAFRENANWKPAAPRDANPRGEWWTLFGDPALDALEARVDVSNQTLKAVGAQFAQARALVRGARANLRPQVAAAPSLASVRQSGTRAFSSFHDPYGDYILPADVSYEADVWGRLHGIVETSRTSAQATAADLETARLSLHAELALDYFTLRGLDREQDILNSAVRAYEQALELTNNRFRGGLSSQADVAQAETQLETTRAVLVGQPASTFTLAPSPLAGGPPEVPIGVPSDLLERRSDIAGAERRVAAATAQVGVTASAFYPIVTLSGALGFESSSFGNWLAGASNFWSAAPAALINVFDAGRRQAANDQAQAAFDEASASYRESLLSAFREVEDQLAALRVLDEEAKIQDRAVEASERSLTLATNRYRGGVTGYLEVITAQNAALANERTAVGILIRRMNATVLLLKGLGGDWKVSALPQVAGSK